MYEKLLSMTWADIMESDYIFKSNFEKRVIVISASEVSDDKDDDSIILIYYNVYTGKPIVLLHHYNKKGMATEIPDIEGYHEDRTEGVNEDGEDFTEVLYVEEDISKLED